MKTFLSLCGAIALLLPAMAFADEASHRKAAESLLNMMNMETLMTQTIDQMLAAQVQSNPAIAAYQGEMKSFLNKYMSWASMKDDMVKLYMAEFTEDELKELNAFYNTPVGKKTVQRMPALMAKGAEIGQKRVQEHMGELQQAIMSKAAPGASAPAGAKKSP